MLKISFVGDFIQTEGRVNNILSGINYEIG